MPTQKKYNKYIFLCVSSGNKIIQYGNHSYSKNILFDLVLIWWYYQKGQKAPCLYEITAMGTINQWMVLAQDLNPLPVKHWMCYATDRNWAVLKKADFIAIIIAGIPHIGNGLHAIFFLHKNMFLMLNCLRSG